MPVKNAISNAGWPTSGTPTVNAGESGFAVVDGATTGFVGGQARYEVDELNQKYISTLNTNNHLYVKVDANADVFTAGETRHHVEIECMLEFTGQAAGNIALGTPGANLIAYDSGSGQLVIGMGKVDGVVTGGYYFTFGGFSGVTVSGALDGAGREPPIKINQRVRLQFFVTKGDAGLSIAGMCVNGVRQGRGTATAGLAWPTALLLCLPAIPGGRWRVYGATSWTGNDHTFSPMWTTFPPAAEDGLDKTLAHTASDGIHGTTFTYATDYSLASYESGGVNPNQVRVIGGTNGYVATSLVDIGALRFNQYGICNFLTEFYVPSGATFALQIRDPGNTFDVAKFSISGANLLNFSGGNIVDGSAANVPVSVSARYWMLMHFNSAGSITYTLMSSTVDANARMVWSGVFPTNNFRSTLGKVIATGSNANEWGRVDVGPWWANAICDSLVAAYCTTTTPVRASTTNNITIGFPTTDALAVPNGAYNLSWHSFPKQTFMATSARSGRRRLDWINNSRTYMTHTTGMDLYTIDAACFNDINNDATADTMLTYLQGDLDFCDARRCRLHLMPSWERAYGLGFSLTTARSNQRRRFNALQEQFVLNNYSNERLYYYPHYRAWQPAMPVNDGVHPYANNLDLGRAIAATRMTARAFANLYYSQSSGVSGGSGISNGGPAQVAGGRGLVI